jgi:antitoxin (DNA-binding transcriptional repressor) of toxin-antitoxin stability system
MKTVTILELKSKAGEFVRLVMRIGEEVQIIDNDEVVALLVPTGGVGKYKNGWTTLDKIAAEMNKNGG